MIEEKQIIPDITPMRRGRPTRAEGDSRVPKPSPSPLRAAGNDPWAALDLAPMKASGSSLIDDVSVRFPALDDFSLLHDSGSKFAFDPKRDSKKQPSRDISQRVTDALADEAFIQPKTTSVETEPQGSHDSQQAERGPKPNIPEIPRPKPTPKPDGQQTISQRPTMVSTGTMTSPSPPSPTIQSTDAPSRPVFRFSSPSSDHRSSSQPRTSNTAEINTPSPRADAVAYQRPAFLEHRSRSQILTADPLKSFQPPLETNHRSSYLGGIDSTIQRSRSANSKARPMSVQNPSKPNLLRRMSREKAKNEESKPEFSSTALISALTGDGDDGEEAVKIDSNVDFLKAMEEEDASKRKEKRLSSGSRHIKRASMPSVSLAGTKNLLTGRFGDAFKRFETNGVDSQQRNSSRSPIRGSSDLTPIAGSEATDGRSDDGHDLEESEEIPPEMRRELERRRLSQEEKRVADAAAAYRQRLAQGGDSSRGRPGGGPNNKAISIQSKVKTLLDESGRASPSPTKTASGYGRFTDSPAPPQKQVQQPQQEYPLRTTSRQPPSNPVNPQPSYVHKPSLDIIQKTPLTSGRPILSTPAPPSLSTDLPRHSTPPSDRPLNRPIAPPKPQSKPQNLRTGDRAPQSSAKPPYLTSRKPLPQRSQQQQPPLSNKTDGADEDWESSFSKRYPDLAGLEMVETELDGGGIATGPKRPQRELRVRDV